MTTLGLRRVKRMDARTVLIAAAFALWATLVIGGYLKLFKLPGGFSTRLMLTYLVPPVVAGVAVLRRESTPAFNVAAGLSVAVMVALLMPQLSGRQAVYGFGFTALIVMALITHRYPRGSMVTLLVCVGFEGTLTAFTPIPATNVVTGVIAGMWVGMVGRILIGRRTFPLRPTPALFMLSAVFILVIGGVLLTQPVNQATIEFTDVWLRLSVLLLIGYGGFKARTLEGVARLFALIALVTGAYASLRWAIGPAAKEAELNTLDEFRESFNSVDGEQKVQGTLFNGQQLAVWVSIGIPFCLAMAIAWRGRWRLVAIAALPVSIVAMFGSGQRTVVPAVIAGAATIVIVHMVSRSFRGPRLGVAMAAVVALLGAAAIVYPAVLDNPEKRQRYENILAPSQDVPFQERLIKWKQVLADLEGQPFGYGVGAGDNQIPRRFTNVAYNNIDNSYLMFAYDMGIIFAIFFTVTLLVVLFELIRYAIWTRGEAASALCTAAAGVLVSVMIELIAANRVTSPPILAGWVVVALGIAQFGSRREAETA